MAWARLRMRSRCQPSSRDIHNKHLACPSSCTDDRRIHKLFDNDVELLTIQKLDKLVLGLPCPEKLTPPPGLQ